MKRTWFEDARAYLFESKRYIYLAVALFFGCGLIAFLSPSSFSFLDSLLKDLVSKTSGLSSWQLILFILQNNATSAFFTMIAGALFGLPALGNAILNGVVLGYVIGKASSVTSFADILFRIIPHGIFELPAIFIAIGLGMKLGFTFFSSFFTFYKSHKKMRKKGIFSLIIMLLFLVFFLVSTQAVVLSKGDAITLVSFFISFFVFLVSIMIFLSVFFGERRLRKEYIATFRRRFYLSLKVFVTIVLPLLIVAAIIEGLLISYF